LATDLPKTSPERWPTIATTASKSAEMQKGSPTKHFLEEKKEFFSKIKDQRSCNFVSFFRAAAVCKDAAFYWRCETLKL